MLRLEQAAEARFSAQQSNEKVGRHQEEEVDPEELLHQEPHGGTHIWQASTPCQPLWA